MRNRLFALAIVAACSGSTGAFAADLLSPPPPAPSAVAAPVPAYRLLDPQPLGWEVRLGAFAHGVGSVEKGTVAVSGDFVTPRILPAQLGGWEVLIPRAYVGGMLNTAGRTSSVHGGALWTIPVFGGLFVEGFFGGAVHDGSIAGDATHNALGSRTLFHVGGAIGYRFDQHWSVIAVYDHLSNGATAFNTGFARNVGMNSYGLKVAYQF